MNSTQKLFIRPIKEDDLYIIWSLAFKEENPEWKKWDAPISNMKQCHLRNF